MGNKRGGGGATSQKGKRNVVQENDVYFNKPVSDFMIEYLNPHFSEKISNGNDLKILDACANDGVLGLSLSDYYGKQGICPSITLQDIKKTGQSITKYYPNGGHRFDVIVCNPPWVPSSLAEEIYHHLYKNLLKDDGVLIFIINSTFCYQGIDRAKELTFQKYYFLPRYTFKSVGRPLLDAGVMICHKNCVVPKKAQALDCFIPIDRETCKIEYKPVDEWK